jgi:hypothetical protein
MLPFEHRARIEPARRQRRSGTPAATRRGLVRLREAARSAGPHRG